MPYYISLIYWKIVLKIPPWEKLLQTRNSPWHQSLLDAREERNEFRKLMRDQPEDVFPVSKYYSQEDEQMEAFFRYYDYVRKEIDREDEITFKRLTITLTFQAFLVGALAFVLSSLSDNSHSAPADEQMKIQIEYLSHYFRLASLSLLIIFSGTGFFISDRAYKGIDASRKSLAWTKDMWVNFNEKNGKLYPSLVPQPTKFGSLRKEDRKKADQGTDFALAIPNILKYFWLLNGIVWITLWIYSVKLGPP